MILFRLVEPESCCAGQATARNSGYFCYVVCYLALAFFVYIIIVMEFRLFICTSLLLGSCLFGFVVTRLSPFWFCCYSAFAFLVGV